MTKNQQRPWIPRCSRVAIGGAIGGAIAMASQSANAGQDFQIWAPKAHAAVVKNAQGRWPDTKLRFDAPTGLWTVSIPGAAAGDLYLFELNDGEKTALRLDPRGPQVAASKEAQTGEGPSVWSVLTDPGSYQWRSPVFQGASLAAAVIYELHVGSFNPVGKGQSGTFASVEAKLDYLQELGVNYIELLPLHQSARPFDWGYGVSLPLAIENNYGTPDELKSLVDQAHLHGIGVLLDVVHNHYSSTNGLSCYQTNCVDTFAAYYYAGENGVTPWGPRPDYSNPVVRSLIEGQIAQSLNEYRVDGFRWDAVPYIAQFRNYDAVRRMQTNRGDNPDGLSLLREANSLAKRPVLRIAEYFGAPASATMPVAAGGLGFDSRWTGFYPVVDAVTKADVRNIRIRDVAASLAGSNERVIYTETHDEVGHPPEKIRIPVRVDSSHPSSLAARKRSLLAVALMMTSPGVPMLFQGQEFLEAQTFDFPTGTPPDWTRASVFQGITQAYRDLIRLRKNADGKSSVLMDPALAVFHQNDGAKVLAFQRGDARSRPLVILANFGSQSFSSYRIGFPEGAPWRVLFSSDDRTYSTDFGGAPKAHRIQPERLPYDGFAQSAAIELAPFTAVVFGLE